MTRDLSIAIPIVDSDGTLTGFGALLYGVVALTDRAYEYIIEGEPSRGELNEPPRCRLRAQSGLPSGGLDHRHLRLCHRGRVVELCPICNTDHGFGWVGYRAVSCRPKRCDVCQAIMWERDCPECRAPLGKRHECSPYGPCKCHLLSLPPEVRERVAQVESEVATALHDARHSETPA